MSHQTLSERRPGGRQPRETHLQEPDEGGTVDIVHSALLLDELELGRPLEGPDLSVDDVQKVRDFLQVVSRRRGRVVLLEDQTTVRTTFLSRKYGL